MAEQEQVVEATPEEVQEAMDLGWSSRENWRGPAEQWVDAGTFLEKGRHTLPILKQNNERLRGEMAGVRAEVASMSEALRAANAMIETLHASHEADVKEQVAAARDDLKTQLASASREGDHQAVADATAKLSELDAAQAAAAQADKDKPAVIERPAPAAMPPENKAWMDQHPEFTGNARAVALGNAIAVELRAAGDKTVGPAFLDKVKAEVDATLGTGQLRGGSARVEGPRGGGGGMAQGGGKSYADLPAEAKAACDRQAARLVGPNRAHKDIATWRSSYTKQYFGDQQ